MIEVLFTLIVFAALMAILTDTHARAVVAAALLALVWILIDLFGPSLLLAAFLIALAAVIKVAVTGLDTDRGGQQAASFLDEFLTTRDQTDQDRNQHFHRQDGKRTEQLDTDVDSIDEYRR